MRKKKSELKVTVCSRVDPTIHKQIKAKARAAKVTVSQYVETVLTAHVSGPSDQPEEPKAPR